jgi:hypothetical protein
MQENKIIIKFPQSYLDLLNQVFEIEKKVSSLKETNSIHRNLTKMKETFRNIFPSESGEESGLSYHNPIGEPYNETRTDVEASIAGASTEKLFITEVIKPIIRYHKGGINTITQKGIVIVETQNII